MSKKRELTFIEVARAVAIFFVVMIHPIDRLADEANPDTVAIADGYDSRQYFLVSGFVFQMFAATFTFFASEAFVRWAKENGRFTRTINRMASLGGYSYGIYLIHYIFLILMLYLFEYLDVPTAFWIRFPIVLPSILLLSWAGVKIFTLGPLRRIYPILYG